MSTVFHPTRIAGLVVLALASLHAQAQTGASGSTSRSPAGASATTPSTNPTMPSITTAAPKSASGAAASLPRGDRQFVEEAASGGMLEVELGKLAQQKGTSEQVKQFGSRMVADHGKANDELKSVATAKGMTVPTAMERKHQRDMDRLSKLSGAAFDREYMKLMVSDHKKDVSDFQKEARNGKDPEVKAFAAKTLPTLQEHLQMAQTADAAARNAASRGTPAAR